MAVRSLRSAAELPASIYHFTTNQLFYNSTVLLDTEIDFPRFWDFSRHH